MFLLQTSWCTKTKAFPHNSIISIHSICTERPEKYRSLSTFGKSLIWSTVRPGLEQWISKAFHSVEGLYPPQPVPLFFLKLGLLVKAALAILFPTGVDTRREREGLCGIQDLGKLCRSLFAVWKRDWPRNKVEGKARSTSYDNCIAFLPCRHCTTLTVALLGDFEVPLLLIAELVSFGEFENSLFSSFPTVKCYMLTFHSTDDEFRYRNDWHFVPHPAVIFSAKRHLFEPRHCHSPAPSLVVFCFQTQCGIWTLLHLSCGARARCSWNRLGEYAWSCHPSPGFATEQSKDWVW